MLFKKLIFDSYKTYYGHQEINFYIPKEIRDEQGKNIILLGGLNGAGKTTILKAIHYVLFGKRGISEEEHTRLFSNVINNTFYEEGGRDCSVTLILETDKGEEWELRTKWSFDHNKRLIKENRDLTVRKPGARVGRNAQIDNIETYNRFIDKIIPYHAAPFFIFDGEEIKEIILRQNSNEMKEAIHKITGMEAYKQLLGDFTSIKNSLESTLAKAGSQDKLKNVKQELTEIEHQIDLLDKKKKEVLTEKDKLSKLITETKEIRNKKLLLNSQSREVIVKKQSQLETDLRHANSDFKTFFKDNAVNIILSEKITSLIERLKSESQYRQKKIARESALVPYRNFIDQLLNIPMSPPLSKEQLVQIKKIGENIWIEEYKINKEIDDNFIELHDVSNSDFNYLVNTTIKDKSYISNLINKIERLNLQVNNIENELRNAPEAVDINEENSKIDSLSKKLGEFELRTRSNQSKLNKAKETRSALLNQLTRLSDQDTNFDELNNRLKYINKLIKAMNHYVSEMTNLKAIFIKEEFARMLTKLFRKQQEFGKIEFDIKSYTIKLYNDRDQEISIQDRSAGEMQMIASALIWALTKASDLSLPMVIDTPLGRLDSFHRNHLINHYYKELSEQVIILSTDTEVTQDYVELMRDHSYQQYMLDYDESKKYTIIRDGYFNFIKV